MSDRKREERLEALAALGQVSAGVTHEVRNVMTGVIGFAQLARHEAVANPAALGELLGLIEKETQRCLEILSNFLCFARKPVCGPRRFAPADAIHRVARLVQHPLQLKGVKLEVHAGDDAPAVDGDRGAIEQVLLNLVLNAMNAMPDGGHVRIEAGRAADGAALLRVRDDGPGVPAALCEQIFEAFFTTRGGEGTGLGLSLSRQLVEAQGGTLALEPSARGATFVVRLPGCR